MEILFIKILFWKNLIKKNNDGSFEINIDYFNFMGGLEMINTKFEDLFSAPARKADQNISLHYRNVASSIQVVLEGLLIDLVNEAVEITGSKINTCWGCY